MNIFSLFSKPAGNTINARGLKTRLEQKDDIYLLDVRQPEEHRQANINNSALIPLGELQSRIKELEPYKDKEIIVYCRSGARSAQACSILNQNGFNATNLEGGMIAWSRG